VIVDPVVRPALLPETVVQAIAVETCGFAPEVTDRSWNVIVYGWPATDSMKTFATWMTGDPARAPPATGTCHTCEPW